MPMEPYTISVLDDSPVIYLKLIASYTLAYGTRVNQKLLSVMDEVTTPHYIMTDLTDAILTIPEYIAGSADRDLPDTIRQLNVHPNYIMNLYVVSSPAIAKIVNQLARELFGRHYMKMFATRDAAIEFVRGQEV